MTARVDDSPQRAQGGDHMQASHVGGLTLGRKVAGRNAAEFTWPRIEA